MTGDFDKLRDIFHEAVERYPADQWDAYLDRACAGDADLRRQAAALLRAHAEGRSVLGEGGAGGGPTAAHEPAAEAVGASVGPYKLVQEIGEGGMGTVFLARQAEPVRRLVALKVIKAGMDSRVVLARFEAERQALALMDHPNIARVLDAGATDAGRPYFVMELVKGVPITRYCDDHRLTPAERLLLFMQVCHAVQHAHQKGVIHRDLKPSNVLVAPYDGRPVVKVIDFGVAKAAGQPLTEKTLVTGFGAVVGTPQYMSPEQAELNNQDVDTRSDVYALGILLYELLTGTTPLTRERVGGAALLEVLRLVRDEEPPRPSTRLSSTDALPSIAANRGLEPRRLSGVVRGELDWIVMKSLEKDRNRRYETANGFAADVQRYLAGEAVLAVPPSAGYRLRKLARRNRRVLATAGVLAVALLVTLGAVAGSVGWAARDRAARQAAVEKEAELALAEAQRWAEQEKWPEALDAVKRGEGLLAGGGGGEVRDRLLRLRSDVEMMLRLEEVRVLATDLKDQWHEVAAVDDGYEKAFAEYGIDVLNLPVDEAASRIRARGRLAGRLAVALDFWTCSETPRGKSNRAKIQAVAGAVDPDPWRQKLREAFRGGDGVALEQLADSPELMQQSRDIFLVVQHALLFSGKPGKSHAVLRLSQQQFPADFWANYWLAHDLYWKPQSDRDEVTSFARAAVAARPRSAAAHLLLALALQRSGRLDEAVSYHRRAIELAPVNPYAHHDLGWTLHLQGRYEEGFGYLRKAIELWPENYHAYNMLGLNLRAQKKPDEAVAAHRKAIEINGKHVPAHVDLGNALRAQGKLDEAVASYQKAIELDSKHAGAFLGLGNALLDLKKFDEAVAAYRKAIEINPKYADAYNNLGNALSRQNKLDEAIAAYRKAIEINSKYAIAYSNLGLALSKRKKPDEATAAYRTAILHSPASALAHYNLGNELRKQNKVEDAITAYRTAILHDPTYAPAHYNLGYELHKQNRLGEAVVYYRETIKRDPKHAGAYIDLGNALYAQARYGEAILCHRTAILHDPTSAHAYNSLGNALYAQQRTDDAVVYYREAIKRDPKDATPHMNLGNVFVRLGKAEEALTWYRKAVEIEPDNAVAHAKLGRHYSGRPGTDPEAIFHLCKAIRLDPKDPDPHRHLGSLRERQGWPEAALARYRKASELGPRDPGDHLNLAHELKRMGDLDKAIMHYRKAAEGHRDPLWKSAAYHWLGKALWDQGLREEAIECFERCLQISPGARLPGMLAQILANRPTGRDPAGAARLAETVIRSTPKGQHTSLEIAWQGLAWARYRLGDWEGAVAAINKVKELGSAGDSFEWFLLAAARKQLGDEKEARGWYDKAVAWMAKNRPGDPELLGLWSEAAALFGEYEVAPPPRVGK